MNTLLRPPHSAVALLAGFWLLPPLVVMPTHAAATPVSIENAAVRVTWQPEHNAFALVHKATGRLFAPDLAVAGSAGGKVRVVPIPAGPLGAGQAIEVRQPDGSGGRVALYPDQPFAFVQALLANPTAETRRFDTVPVVEAGLDFGRPADSLKALGTAGLTAVDGHTGSYVFLAVADPATRAGVVSAWLTHDRGCGVLFSSVTNGVPSLRAPIDYGRLLLPAGQSTDTETLAIGWFEDARLGLEQYAVAVARWYDIHLRPQPDGYCTWYSNPHGGASDAVHLTELSDFAARELKPFGFDFLQIDDYWQDGKRRNGPAKIFIRQNPEGPYPDGLKPVSEHLARLGLTTGLWWMPFAGDREDPFFADKQEWFVHRPDGTPYWARWGGTSLDMTHPAARDYVAKAARQIAGDWGCRYFKMDGLWTGIAAELLYVNNAYKADDLGEAVFHRPEATPIEAYRSGLRLVREAAGDDVFFLGCNVSQNMRSFGTSMGLLDAMRIGPDNGSQWNGLTRGPWHGANRWFLHGRVWHNDPDPVYLRASMPLEHARLLCSWVAIAGQLTVASDWLPDLPAERLDLLKRILPNHGQQARPVDVFENEMPQAWLLTDNQGGVRRDVVGLFNWREKEPAEIEISADRLGLPNAESYVAFDYWAGEFLAPFHGSLKAQLEPGSCRVLAIRPAADHPQVISTSRHVTQGIVDLSGERWDTASRTLSATSQLVANDPCEIRIVLPTDGRAWQVSQVEVIGADGGQATATVVEEPQRVRLILESSSGGALRWRVQFAGGQE